MVAGVTEMPLTWSVVIPVKVLARAKSRLAGLAGPARSELALAMAADTVRAAAACPVVATVVVVTDDPAAASALGALGAWVVADEPDAGLNPALAHGAAMAGVVAGSRHGAGRTCPRCGPRNSIAGSGWRPSGRGGARRGRHRHHAVRGPARRRSGCFAGRPGTGRWGH
jgi:hypothetical protein